MSEEANSAVAGQVERRVMPHTPGPWIFDGDYIWSEPDRCYVADPQTEDMLSGEAIPKREARARIEANARLIAAAPDLLEALRYMVSDPSEATIAFAKAAIAKATET